MIYTVHFSETLETPATMKVQLFWSCFYEENVW